MGVWVTLLIPLALGQQTAAPTTQPLVFSPDSTDANNACLLNTHDEMYNEIIKCNKEHCQECADTRDCYCFSPLWTHDVNNSSPSHSDSYTLHHFSNDNSFCPYHDCLASSVDMCNYIDQPVSYRLFTREIREILHTESDTSKHCMDLGNCGLGSLHDTYSCTANRCEAGLLERCAGPCFEVADNCSRANNCTGIVESCNSLLLDKMCRVEDHTSICSSIKEQFTERRREEERGEGNVQSDNNDKLILILLGAALVIIIIIVLLFLRWRWKRLNTVAPELKELTDGIKPVRSREETAAIVNALQAGSWTQGKLLGRGTFGSVYLALLPSGNALAVKALDTSNHNGDELSLYIREIETMRELDHPNIVHYFFASYDATVQRINVFMEYVPGGSLARLVRGMDEYLSEGQSSNYIRQILLGVSYLHDNDIIHRDLKGDNVLIDTSKGICKLSDFGSSKNLQKTANGGTVAKTIAGTPNWMAPEIMTSEGHLEHGSKADIWSIGCIVVELLNKGKPPWPEFTTHWAAIYHIATSSGLPEGIPDHLSSDCRDFVESCLHREAILRPSCDELLNHTWISTFHNAEATLSCDSSIPLFDNHIADLIQGQQDKRQSAHSTTTTTTPVNSSKSPSNSNFRSSDTIRSAAASEITFKLHSQGSGSMKSSLPSFATNPSVGSEGNLMRGNSNTTSCLSTFNPLVAQRDDVSTVNYGTVPHTVVNPSVNPSVVPSFSSHLKEDNGSVVFGSVITNNGPKESLPVPIPSMPLSSMTPSNFTTMQSEGVSTVRFGTIQHVGTPPSEPLVETIG